MKEVWLWVMHAFHRTSIDSRIEMGACWSEDEAVAALARSIKAAIESGYVTKHERIEKVQRP